MDEGVTVSVSSDLQLLRIRVLQALEDRFLGSTEESEQFNELLLAGSNK